MRKILIYIFIFILLVFSIPLLFTNINTEETVSVNVVENVLDDSKYGKIRLFHINEKEIELLDMNEYLCGVVAAEMPASFEIEALKAQAIVARTYTVYKMKNGSKHENADICDNSTCCQAWMSKESRLASWEEDKKDEYWNKIVKSVNDTNKKIITYNRRTNKCIFS